ncbi:M1 family metallopeptidase [Nocardioides sp.]|uniref:M1 family metallopeptidase n=1 Tax=Nocardioides sp. TaxID=35761 RepID=UPI003782F10B
MTSRTRILLATLLGLLLTATLAPGASASRVGIGDPYYPTDGNGGYDVRSYRIAVDYGGRDHTIAGSATVSARATKRLPRFDLDLDGLTVTDVTVDGRRATWRRAGAHELVITPARPVGSGAAFQVVVRYHGRLHNVDDGGAPSGFIAGGGAPGAGYLEGEPHGCATWYPCNDHPTDKARYALAITVPRPLELVSVGVQGPTTAGVRDGVPVRTYRWRMSEPISTYLVGWYADRLTVQRSRLADGTPVVSAYGPGHAAVMRREARLPEILRVLSQRWGPYPAPAAGGMFVDDDIPYELETYGRPVYSTRTSLLTIVHENGHMWWGDHIALHRWKDICFNECLASYSEWLWREHQGADLDRIYRQGVRRGGEELFGGKLYDMGAGDEFDSPVYVKGAYFVHALRNKIGDARFFAAMRTIQRRDGGGVLSMNGWRDQLERLTGVDLTSFWRDWVLTTGRPSRANLFPGGLGR